jgi:glutamate/aspartate transport system permease protein
MPDGILTRGLIVSAWDWQVFCKDTIEKVVVTGCFGKGGDITYLDWLLSAWGWTLTVSALALVIALVLGVCMGVLRTLPHKGLAFVGEAWTELFRNIPVLVQVLLWYFVVPEFIPVLKQMPSFLLAACGLGFFTSARISEQVRAGIQSLPKGQRYAGLAMGLTLGQTYRYVLLPVALRVVIPPLTSEAMGIIKNSAVAFAVSIAELIMFARQAAEETSKGVEIYLAVTLLYFVSSLAVFALARFIEIQVRVPGFLGAKQ